MKRLLTILLLFISFVSFAQNRFAKVFNQADSAFKTTVDWKRFSHQIDSILNYNEQVKLFNETNDIISNGKNDYIMINVSQFLQEYWIGYIDGISSNRSRKEQLKYLKDFIISENTSIRKEINRRKSKECRNFYMWKTKKELMSK